VYFDENGSMTATNTFEEDLIRKYALVSIMYWNADDDEIIYCADERHGFVMDSATHI